MTQISGRFAQRSRKAEIRTLRTLALLVSVGALVGAAPAQAGVQHEYEVFNNCPTAVMGTKAICIVSTTTSGEFILGAKTVPINQTITLQGGVDKGILVPATNGETLSKTPLVVPGGLVGVELLPPLTTVTATAELAGQGEVSTANALSGEGTAVSLPLTVKLDNPLLGASCRVGTSSEPVQLNLITGKTNPPPPNGPISGSTGTLEMGGFNKPGIDVVNNDSFVDNAFAAPGVNGCVEPASLVFDPLVDISAGLPAAAGHNTAILNGTTLIASSLEVAREAVIPEFGRCKKVPVEHVEGERVFHGGWLNSICTNESVGGKFGEFEWTPGAGPKHTFSVTAAATTFESSASRRLHCAKATGSGEYTGSKTVALTLKLVGCQLSPNKEVCTSAGAAAGEVRTGSLQGRLGFIEDQFKEGVSTNVLGLAVGGSPTVLSAECGASKVPVSVSGSAIAQLTPFDLMSASFALQFSQSAGSQTPASFEDDPEKHAMSIAIGGGSPESAGLGAGVKLKNAEHYEVKASP